MNAKTDACSSPSQTLARNEHHLRRRTPYSSVFKNDNKTNHGFDRGRVEIEACRHARSQYLRPAPRLSFQSDSDCAALGTAARSEAGLPTSGRWHGIVRNCEAQTPC